MPESKPSEPTVVVVGAINVDAVVAADRLPAAGETVVGPEAKWFGGGKGANAAVAAARAGASVALVGAVGADDPGRGALAELAADGVDVGGIDVLADTATGVALIVVDPAGENQIAVGAGANAAVTGAHVRYAMSQVLAGAGCVLVSTEIPDEAVVAAVEAATDAGVTCVLNPAPVTGGVRAVLDRGVILTPNRGELDDLGGVDAVVAAGAGPVAVTLGGDGVDLHRPGGDTVRYPAPTTEVVDTTGAGDTFNGVLAARLAAGDDLDAAVATAVVAASLSVRHLGARGGMPTAAAIDRAQSS